MARSRVRICSAMLSTAANTCSDSQPKPQFVFPPRTLRVCCCKSSAASLLHKLWYCTHAGSAISGRCSRAQHAELEMSTRRS